MACVPTPTSTLFGSSEVVSNSLSTSTTISVSALPPTTVTTTETSCADPSLSSGACSTPVTTVLTSTIPGTTTTITSQITVTVPITFTTTFPTQTLFSTCPPDQSSQSSNSGPNNSGPSSVFTSASESTLPNGQMTTTFVTFTSSSPPQTVFVPSSQSPGLNNSGNTPNSSTSNLGPIIGGVLGGFFGLLLFAGAFMCWRRRRRWEDIYEKDSVHGIDEDDRPVQAPEPAPYHYGLVGHHPSPSISPPGSPASRPTTYHSRVNSSAGISVVSRESTVPLNAVDSLKAPPPDVYRPPSHSRRPSQGSEGLLLMRPLDLAAPSSSSLDTRGRSVQPNVPGSPTTPRQTFFPLRVTNVDEGDVSSSHAFVDEPVSPKPTQEQSTQFPVVIHTDGGRFDDGSGVIPREDPPAYKKRA